MPFDEAALGFLRDLEANNDREWFQPRKAMYESAVRAPMVELVEAVNSELASVAPDHVTEPAKSIYRIYRDTRFSPDKTPYKTHIGALFPHRQLGKETGAAFYFHLAATGFLVAGGLYHSGAAALTAQRAHIAATHPRLTALLKHKGVREYFGAMQGDRLTRPPKGWSADHPAIEYLKHKDFLLEVEHPPEAGLGKTALKDLLKGIRLMTPFIGYLNEPYLNAAARRDPLLDRQAVKDAQRPRRAR